MLCNSIQCGNYRALIAHRATPYHRLRRVGAKARRVWKTVSLHINTDGEDHDVGKKIVRYTSLCREIREILFFLANNCFSFVTNSRPHTLTLEVS